MNIRITIQIREHPQHKAAPYAFISSNTEKPQIQAHDKPIAAMNNFRVRSNSNLERGIGGSQHISRPQVHWIHGLPTIRFGSTGTRPTFR